jgi:hypothetical protein
MQAPLRCSNQETVAWSRIPLVVRNLSREIQ